MQSPNTLLFTGPDSAPVPVSAADPLPVGSGGSITPPTGSKSPEALLFAGPDGSPVAVSSANPLPVVVI